ncbi:AAEL005624-PA [Aedes aegypti]|uniref:AAEL005624-PA n=2 Tax=Aedes aegypti TaxID=7159 RepID=Q179H5_AEDAE|nr:AAEL005624-PA [Aedes aegypti]
MKHYLYIILISIMLGKHYAMTHVIRKRQLFREQVLPHAGGKIPDSAFHTDRLALNRLQKDGIAVPDGVLLEQRRYQVYPHPHRSSRPTFLVAQTPDGRYTSPEGAYSHNGLETVDSTYAIPMPWEKDSHYKVPSSGYAYGKPAAVPVFKELRVPNYSVFNFDYSNIKSKLLRKPASLYPTAAIASAYSPASISHHRHLQPAPPKPSLSVVPQNYVAYHAALGNLLSYQNAASAYGSDWDKDWAPSSAFHLNHDLSSSHFGMKRKKRDLRILSEFIANDVFQMLPAA